MRTRLFVISSLAVVAVLGASAFDAASAAPNGPGNISQSPGTTAPPYGPKDKYAPKPTTTTTVPAPKGPDDIAPAPTTTVPAPAPAPTDDDAPEGNTKQIGNPELVPAPQTAAQPADVNVDVEGDRLPPLALILVAGLVGALLALVVTRVRRDA